MDEVTNRPNAVLRRASDLDPILRGASQKGSGQSALWVAAACCFSAILGARVRTGL